jgi:hypothetical protein
MTDAVAHEAGLAQQFTAESVVVSLGSVHPDAVDTSQGARVNARRLGDPLKDGGDALAAPAAHRLETVRTLPAVQLPKHCGHDSAPGGAERVAH